MSKQSPVVENPKYSLSLAYATEVGHGDQEDEVENYLTVEDIVYRLKDLRPGEKVIYYKGNLANMTPIVGSHITSRLAWDLYEEGRVHLLQRRLGKPKTFLNVVDWQTGVGPGFEYIAVGRSRKSKAPNFTSHLRSVMEPV